MTIFFALWQPAYVLVSACRRIVLTLFFAFPPSLLVLASADSSCFQFSGHSSGVDGQSCTADLSWNDTLWRASDGLKCATVDQLGIERFSHNGALEGCSAALARYRAVSQSRGTPFTCNCTGDYSYLGDSSDSLRVGSVLVITTAVQM